MTERVGVVRHEAATAAVAAMDGLTASFVAGSSNYIGFVIVRECRSDVLDMTVAANRTLTNGVTGRGTGSGNSVSFVLVFTLGRGGLLHLSAAGTQFQHLAVCFAGRITNDNALPCVTERIYIVALFDFSTIRAEVAVITEGGAACLHFVEQSEMVILAASLIGAAVTAAVLVLTATIWIRTAASAGAVLLGGFIAEPDLCDTVLGHFLALVSIGNLVIHIVLTSFGVVGCRGQRAGIGRIAVAGWLHGCQIQKGRSR